MRLLYQGALIANVTQYTRAVTHVFHFVDDLPLWMLIRKLHLRSNIVMLLFPSWWANLCFALYAKLVRSMERQHVNRMLNDRVNKYNYTNILNDNCKLRSVNLVYHILTAGERWMMPSLCFRTSFVSGRWIYAEHHVTVAVVFGPYFCSEKHATWTELHSFRVRSTNEAGDASANRRTYIVAQVVTLDGSETI